MSAQTRGTLHGINSGLVILRDIVVPGWSGGDVAACGKGLSGGKCSARLRIVSKDADELLNNSDRA